MARTTASCASASRPESACASVTPRAPSSTRCWSGGANRSASTRRRSTHAGLLPSTEAIVFGPAPSTHRMAATTRASSIAVTVRRGALARSSISIRSSGAPERSMIAVIVLSPYALARRTRLNPSITSKVPSTTGETRIGISARPLVSPRRPPPPRSSSRPVRTLSSGSSRTTPMSPIMRPPLRAARPKGARAPGGSHRPRARGREHRRPGRAP